MSEPLSEPLDLIKLSLDELVYIKLRGAREVVGRLHAYDSHCNVIVSDAEETIFVFDDDETQPRTVTKKSSMLFLRGDSVILVSNVQNE